MICPALGLLDEWRQLAQGAGMSQLRLLDAQRRELFALVTAGLLRAAMA